MAKTWSTVKAGFGLVSEYRPHTGSIFIALFNYASLGQMCFTHSNPSPTILESHYFPSLTICHSANENLEFCCELSHPGQQLNQLVLRNVHRTSSMS
jgi:hypothetical protein